MSDPVPMSTRTIWLAAAVVFGLAFLVSVFKGSIIVAVLLLLLAGGCVFQSRRAPRNDADPDARKAEAERDEGDEDDEANDEANDERDADERQQRDED